MHLCSMNMYDTVSSRYNPAFGCGREVTCFNAAAWPAAAAKIYQLEHAASALETEDAAVVAQRQAVPLPPSLLHPLPFPLSLPLSPTSLLSLPPSLPPNPTLALSLYLARAQSLSLARLLSFSLLRLVTSALETKSVGAGNGGCGYCRAAPGGISSSLSVFFSGRLSCEIDCEPLSLSVYGSLFLSLFLSLALSFFISPPVPPTPSRSRSRSLSLSSPP